MTKKLYFSCFLNKKKKSQKENTKKKEKTNKKENVKIWED